MIKIIYTFLMLFVCTSTGCVTDDDPKGPSLQVGDPLPQFSVTLNNGVEISTANLKGKVPVIVFFNTGCSDCRQELPVIQQLWDNYKENSNVVIAVIAREETKEEIQKYWAENGLSMPFSPQDNKEVYNLFAPSVIPRIYIADKSGIITATFDDSGMPSLETLISEIVKNNNLTSFTPNTQTTNP